jgi:arginine/lysine/ornithine decarboxylase
MLYPPGIPILAPGELITKEAVEYIRYAKEKGCNVTGTQDEAVEQLYVLR